MILKMIISVILLYYLAVLWQYFRHDLMRSFWKAEEADDEPEEKTDEPYTVIGKSTYRKRQTDEPDDKQYVPTPEEVEEEEGLGAYYPDGNPDFATGYTFEDLKKVHRIMVTDAANEQEKQQAREVLPVVMGSDVWDEMLDEFEGARQRVARLMNNNNV